MRLSFLFFLVLSFFQSSAQILTVGYKGYITVLKEDSNIVIKTDEYQERIIMAKVYDKTEKHLLELYQRFDDSSFLYSSFDENDNIISKGLLSLSKKIEKKDIIMVPDWGKDPTGSTMKDTIIQQYYKYLKSSYWTEIDDSNFVWKGLYFKDKKEGEWWKLEHKNEDCCLLDIQHFKSGKVIINKILIWPLIKGNWYQTHQSDTSILIYTHLKDFSDRLSFKSRDSLEHLFRVTIEEFRRVESSWQFENDVLLLSQFYKRAMRFKILKLDKNELILKIIE